MRKILAIINPAAGSRSAPEVKDALQSCFSPPETDVILYETTGEEDVPAVVRRYLTESDFDLVLVAGGDGSVSDVANGMHGFDLPLGIIPAGTGNAVAQELALSSDVQAVCDAYAAGQCPVQEFDAIKLDDRYYLLHVSIGLGARVMRTSRALKNRIGMLAYIWTLIGELRRQTANRYRIIADGRDYEMEGLEVLIANAAALGIPTLHWGKHIRPDDGVIDVCMIRPQKWTNYFSVILNILRGKPEEDRFVRYLAVKNSLRVESLGPRPIKASGDGEKIGETPLEMTVVPSFVKLLRP